MCDCGCSISLNEEKTDPSLDDYKSALKHLGTAIKSAHKSTEGKKLSSEYWVDILGLLKKAKLGVSMMELGIDDEEEIKDLRKSNNNNKSAGEEENSTEGGKEQPDKDAGEDKAKKQAAAGLKKENSQNDSNKDLYDVFNHLSILLTESKINFEFDGANFHIKDSDRSFNIKFDEKFYLISDHYNYELGDTYDLNEVVCTFQKLIKNSEYTLRQEYNNSILE